MSGFIDRVGQNLNRKNLVVENVTYKPNGDIDCLTIKEYRNDSNITVAGTKLNAENLNMIINEMIDDKIDILINNLLTDSERIQIDKRNLEKYFSVITNCVLPNKGFFGSLLSCTSLTPSVISIYNRDMELHKTNSQQNAILRFNLLLNNYSDSRDINVVVPPIMYIDNCPIVNLEMNIVLGGSDSDTVSIENLDGLIPVIQESDSYVLFIVHNNADGYLSMTATYCANYELVTDNIVCNVSVRMENSQTGITEKIINVAVNIYKYTMPED